MKDKVKRFISTSWGLLIIIVVAYLVSDNDLGGLLLFIFLFTLKLIASFAAVVLVHEIGHLIFGLLFKFKFITFSALIFNFYNENGKVKFRIRVPKNIIGYCMMIPKVDPISHYLWFIAGGILFNLISGLAGLFIWIYFSKSSNFLLIFAIVSLLLAISNTIPHKRDTIRANDGWKIQALLFKKDESKKLIEKWQAAEAAYSDKRPREYNIPFDKDEEYEVPYYMGVYSNALDKGDIETLIFCSKMIEDNFDTANDITFLSYCYIIIHTSCITGDLDKAKIYYKKCRKQAETDNDCNGYRVRAYYEFYANNNAEYAYELCQKGLDVVDKFVHKGFAMMEKDLIEKLQKQIDVSKDDA